jgi:hypothetical protein
MRAGQAAEADIKRYMDMASKIQQIGRSVLADLPAKERRLRAHLAGQKLAKSHDNRKLLEHLMTDTPARQPGGRGRRVQGVLRRFGRPPLALARLGLRGAVQGLEAVRGTLFSAGPADHPHETGWLAAEGYRFAAGDQPAGGEPASGRSSDQVERNDRRLTCLFDCIKEGFDGGRGSGHPNLFFRYAAAGSQGPSLP